MPKFADVISHLKVDDRTYSKPVWWNSKRQLNKIIKRDEKISEIIKNATPRVAGSYSITPLERQPVSDTFYADILRGQLDSAKYSELAPWNPAFQKSKVILIDRK